MRFYFLILIALILSVSACKVSDDASDPTLARVENSELKLSEMRKDETWDSLSQDEKFLRVESWLSRASIYEQALAEGVDKLPEVQNLLEDAKKKIVLDEPIRTLGTHVIQIKLHKDVTEINTTT